MTLLRSAFFPAILLLAALLTPPGPLVAQQSEPPAEPLPDLELVLEAATVDEASGEVTPATVVVTGLSPAGVVALTFLNRTAGAFGATVNMGTELLTDDDEDGAVTYTPEGGIARVSSWVAVDLSAGDGGGRVAQASPSGFTPKPRKLPAKALERGGNGQLRRLRRDGQIFYTALLRSGEDTDRGAWSLVLEDGGRGDEDQRGNGRITFQPESAEPVGTSPVAPQEFQGGDVLVMVQPRTFALTVLAIKDTGPPQDLTHQLLGVEEGLR